MAISNHQSFAFLAQPPVQDIVMDFQEGVVEEEESEFIGFILLSFITNTIKLI